MKRQLLLVFAACCLLTLNTQAQTMKAVTTPGGPGLHVVLTWPSKSPTARYNLYRKVAGAASYPATPLNSAPLARPAPAACANIKAVIPPGSPEWTAIAEGIQSGTPFDPCNISTLAANSAPESKLQFLARTRWKIAVAAGQGYIDGTVTNGTAYEYELRSVNAVGTETGVLFTKVAVTAGSPPLIPAPAGLTAVAGDSRVLLLWGKQDDAAGFVVLRSTAAAGPFVRINEAGFLTRINQDVDGKPMPASNGFLDMRRWAGDGTPATHTVGTNNIDGPANGTTYFYKIASLDMLEQQGPASATPVPGTPVDKVPPTAPVGVICTPVDSQNKIEVRWTIAQLDTDGHLEGAPISQYRLYRYDAENAPLGSGVQIAVVGSPPAGQTYVTASDSAPILRPPFGEKTYWYRINAIDAAGNEGALSAAAGAHLKDITPPAPPKGVSADGFDQFIRIKWSANSEPDLDGYLIYRTLCHNGVANPCEPTDKDPFDPRQGTGATDDRNKGDDYRSKRVPCTGEYVIVGSVTQAEARSMGSTVTFEDHTVPPGSPLCYSYWIKAYDKAQNKSGSWPFPDPSTEKTVCQRLRDKTPPEAAIISALLARDTAIRVEWVGPPIQDIRAYHVYRSDTENGTYKWVGGMTVEPPPNPPKTMTQPYTPPALVDCANIPLVTIDSMSMGFFVDTNVEAKSIYWYKVVGIDQSGNEAPLKDATPISTFAFTTSQPASPAITSITGSSAAPFALVVRWTPVFDASRLRGFALFRSDRVDGIYRQIGTLLTQAEYQDSQVVKGVSYWYKVVQMDLTGQLSQPSAAATGMLTP